MSRHARAVDATQPAIVEALRQRGHLVQHLHAVGNGCPDLLVGARVMRLLKPHQLPPGLAAAHGDERVLAIDRRLLLLEVKRPRNKRGDLEPLTEAEADWHHEWSAYPVFIVGSVDEAIRTVEASESLTTPQLARRFGVSRDAVTRWLRAAGVKAAKEES